MQTEKNLVFPPNFVWGTASSAYQIEGAWDIGGRGLSIWDTFSHVAGNIERNENGDTAADHYHRWQEDIALMAQLGLPAYRFSISWSRVLPQGRGEINQTGLDFYDRLVDSLLEKNIEPYVTLYHWDLPQALQDQGGWMQPRIVDDFARYAEVVGQRLGDRVSQWITHNEPMVAALLGHYLGIHAPGLRDPGAAFSTGLHLLQSHAAAVRALRASCTKPPKIGITINLSPVHPASDKPEDIRAAREYDLITNRFFLNPPLLGSLPAELYDLLGTMGVQLAPEEVKKAAEPIDFLGINYYSRAVIQHDPQGQHLMAGQVNPIGNEYSQMWEIYPEGIYELLKMVQTEYLPASFPGLRVLITENGICVPDGIDYDGRVRDERRIRYLHRHLAQVHRAIAEGVPLDGYFVWSLIDNFEWSFGYQMRFGMVHIDFETLKRTVKDSANWYASVIAQNALPAFGE